MGPVCVRVSSKTNYRLSYDPFTCKTNFFPQSSPMTIEYSQRKDFVTVNIPLDFKTKLVCKLCVDDGPHITPDHVFRIILTTTMDGSHELRMFNDQNNVCIIPPETNGFESLRSLVCTMGNDCYFYGRVDEDDSTALYINIESLPDQ